MAQTAYCYDDEGYYTHSEPCQRDPLESVKQEREIWLVPANACLDAPEIKGGYVPRRVNGRWTQVENHKDEKGYVNGRPNTITDYGPYPDGWSTEPPLPTVDELFARLRAARDARLRNKYDTALAQLNRGIRLAENDAERTKLTAKIASWDAWAVELCNLPTLSGAPWDGGGDATPWPPAPLAV